VRNTNERGQMRAAHLRATTTERQTNERNVNLLFTKITAI